MERLNSKQRQILEENHGLIKGFIKKRKLNVNEYYSIVSDSLVKAILAHNEDKGKLSTFFTSIAKNDVAYEQRKVKVEVLGISDDYAVQIERASDSSYSFETAEPTEESNSALEEDFDVSSYLSYLEDFEIKICRMLYEGKFQREIAEEFGVSQQSISKRLRIIRKKIKGELKNGQRATITSKHIG